MRESAGPGIQRGRNAAERPVDRLEHFRRVATRRDKPAASYLAMVTPASVRVWARFEAVA